MKQSTKNEGAVGKFIQRGDGVSPERMEDSETSLRQAEDQARIKRITEVGRTKVADLLNARTIVYDWTHPVLYDKKNNRQGSVREFFPDFLVAIDKFFNAEDFDQSEVEAKKIALNSVGIRYAALTPDKDWADVLSELEQQPKVAGDAR